MRVAITGATGFIGSYVCRLLARSGHTVTALARTTSRTDHVSESIDRIVVGDQSDESVFADLVADADCVIHNSVDWNAVREPGIETTCRQNIESSLKLLEASRPMPFIFISTIAVHHDMRPRWDGNIDEDHPLRPSTRYGAMKAAIEAFLWAEHHDQGRSTCALRPCGVYGLDPRLDRSHGYALVRKIVNGQPVTRKGGGKFVHVEDVAAMALAAVEQPDRVSGRCFNLVDCYARWADWATMASAILDAGIDIDMESPEHPANTFSREAARELGVRLDRGHAGIREYLEQLIGVMKQHHLLKPGE